MNTPPILDMCCGSRMFWFDPKDRRALFVDKRKEKHMLTDTYSRGGVRPLVIAPDFVADFTNLPFADETFHLIVFDPPHLEKVGGNSWLAKKYGKLNPGWRKDLQKGFSEGFRVLKPTGVLIFKWNETDVPLSDILELTAEKPLFGHRSGKAARTHWVTFMKMPVSRNVDDY